MENKLIYGENTRIGYKVFNPDWTCLNYQYKVGKEYKHKGIIEICKSGFHFCENLIDCFNYYQWNTNNKVAIIHYDATCEIQKDDDKSCTNKIFIAKEIDWLEIFKICNSGLNNTGNRNSGDWNSGSWNSGDRNSGDCNSGNRNSGSCNSGSWNSGDRNSGDRNSGDRNSGDWNSGDWNSGNRNSGFFNTISNNVFIFDSLTNLKYEDVIKTEWYKLIFSLNFKLNVFVFSENMSSEEKEKFPHHETLGGYLKKLSYKEAWQESLKNITDNEKEIIKSIPNFDSNKFEEITGVKI